MLYSTEVMSLLRINRATLCRWCRKGILPNIRMQDGSYRLGSTQLQAWVGERSTT
jgi:predicted site-specific integrase-resolvase